LLLCLKAMRKIVQNNLKKHLTTACTCAIVYV
jgi:hypothetical protein